MKFSIACILMKSLRKPREVCDVHLHRTLEILGSLEVGHNDQVIISRPEFLPLCVSTNGVVYLVIGIC